MIWLEIDVDRQLVDGRMVAEIESMTRAPAAVRPRMRVNWTLIAVLLIAFVLRMFLIDAQELRGDEGFSWVYASAEPNLLAVAERIVREGESPPPLHYWLMHGWVRVFGESEFALRSISAFLSWLLVPSMFQLARQALGRDSQIPLIVAALTALHPYQIWMAQDVRNMYQMALAPLLLGTWHLPGLLRGRRRSWTSYVLFGSLAMYSHYYAVFGLIAHGMYAVLTRRQNQALRWLSAAGAVALTLLPWMVIILPAYAATGEFHQAAPYPLPEYLVQTLRDTALGPSIADAPAALGVLVAGVMVVAGAVVWWRFDLQWAGVMIAWPVLALVGIYTVLLVRPIFNTFYFIVAFPPLYLFFAIALDTLWRSRRLVAVGIATLALLGFTAGLRTYYFEPSASKTRGLRELAAYLADEARAGDVLITNFPDPAVDYYLRRVELPARLLPTRADFEPSEVNAAVDALSGDYDRLWHMPVRASNWDADGYVEARLADRFTAATDLRFNKVRLRLFVVQPETLPEYAAWNVEFDDGVTLLGSYVTVNGDPNNRRPQPGDWLRVTLRWTTAMPVDGDYAVYVHALNRDGQIAGQHDGVPHDGGQPTVMWQPGAAVLDVHEFQLPPESSPSDITIRVGMYDPVTLDRLSLLDGSDGVTIWPHAPH